MAKIFIGVGSNLGNRKENIIRAIKYLEEKIEIKKISSFLETNPEEGVKGDKFLNGVIEGKTSLSPKQLFNFLHKVERKIGRKFPHRKNEKREIDLDILFYDRLILKEKKLKIPHPKLNKRYFVLKPFVEIASDFIDPVSQKTIINLYNQLIEKR